MSVVVRRQHPSGEVGISVAAFHDTKEVVVGIGNLRDMKYIALSREEAVSVSDAIEEAATFERRFGIVNESKGK